MSSDGRTKRWTIILTGRRQDWLLAIDARFLFPIPADDTTEHARTHRLLLPECTVATTFKMVCKYRSADT